MPKRPRPDSDPFFDWKRKRPFKNTTPTKWLSGASGAALGFIAGNLPGAVAGGLAGAALSGADFNNIQTENDMPQNNQETDRAFSLCRWGRRRRPPGGVYRSLGERLNMSVLSGRITGTSNNQTVTNMNLYDGQSHRPPQVFQPRRTQINRLRRDAIHRRPRKRKGTLASHSPNLPTRHRAPPSNPHPLWSGVHPSRNKKNLHLYGLCLLQQRPANRKEDALSQSVH